MNTKPKIIVINGPNLNLLGTRKQKIYGVQTLVEIEAKCRDEASNLSIALDFFQSNSEGEIVTKIQQSPDNYQGIIINAAAYSHSSIAILDALEVLEAADLPIIEVHLSNIYAREEFRRKSLISSIASGVICGFGGMGYLLALKAIAKILHSRA
ncbi:3-dehydroquinate dehydratase [Rickettsiales bacterium]|nr:3-dehydroquinate dehydratase [Rickettsiales bacterium]